jgi:aryl-alcohol dehydrogenase-like predicted oxidoreductase
MLSEICFGTMRLPATVDGRSAADYLCHLHDLGIDTHHSSHEYDTHPVYLDALAAARKSGRGFEHIVKLSEPGFDDQRFDGRRLSALLESQLTVLGTDRVASLQWLFRTPDAQDSEGRVATMTEQGDEIAAWIEDQKASGKVADVSVFPYSLGFGAAAIDLGLSRTLCTYLNLAELEYVPLLDEVDAFIAIRPLAGGRLVDQASEAIRFALLHPKVTTTVLSVSSEAHLQAALAAVDGAAPDQEAFDRIVADRAQSPAGEE